LYEDDERNDHGQCEDTLRNTPPWTANIPDVLEDEQWPGIEIVEKGGNLWHGSPKCV
jgi:hypothetical protein